jgi:polyisoprenoid-binding protein YceI
MSTLTETQAVLPQGSWTGDTVHSHVGFELPYATGTFRGSFSPFEATLEVGEDGSAILTGEARADSVHVLDENLNAHLLSPDFFDAENAPVLSFRSTSIASSDAGLTIAGELTIKGATAPVELEATVAEAFPHPSGREFLPVHIEGTLDRRAVGIDWNMELPNGQTALGWDVSLVADLFFVRS